jgi:hypothetical protein
MKTVRMETSAAIGRPRALRGHPARALSLPDVWIDAIVLVLCIFPLLLTAHIPMEDLPNHLARQYVLRDLAHSPALQQYYYVQWGLVPNLALELYFVCVRWFLPLDFAMRLFCILTVLLLFLGTRAVNRTLSDGTSRLYRAVPVICWGGPLQEGFLNYCFGVGLALVLYGTWLRLRERNLGVRTAFLLAAGTGLMLCHLAAFGLFAIAAGVTELVGPDRWRRHLLHGPCPGGRAAAGNPRGPARRAADPNGPLAAGRSVRGRCHDVCLDRGAQLCDGGHVHRLPPALGDLVLRARRAAAGGEPLGQAADRMAVPVDRRARRDAGRFLAAVGTDPGRN